MSTQINKVDRKKRPRKKLTRKKGGKMSTENGPLGKTSTRKKGPF